MNPTMDYDELDGTALAALVASGEASPAELVDEAILRIEARNPQVNAVVQTQFEAARTRATGPLPDGPFRGVPFLLKDLLAEQEGEPSTASCSFMTGWRAPRDAELVRRFGAAGVVVLGRTNTPELGLLGVTEPVLRGPARNPWNLGHTTGGSSGGSAAAVAARMVPMAHGGDGGGSIRIPASACGLVGLKPTRARSPMGPFRGESWDGLVVEHVLTRSVRDSAAMLDAVHGPDPGAPYQVLPPERPFRKEVGADPGRLRIAFTTRALFGSTTHSDCVRAVEDAARLAESLGHHVEEACPPYDRDTLVRGYLLVVAANTSAALRLLGELVGREPTARDVEPPTWLLKRIGDAVTAADYVWYRQVMQRAAREMVPFFERYDVLLTPTLAAPPVTVGALDLTAAERALAGFLGAVPVRRLLLVALDQLAKDSLDATPNTMLFNITGQPAINLPLMWNDGGLPIGSQWVGRFGDEATLLRLASQLEQARPWAARRPPLLDVG